MMRKMYSVALGLCVALVLSVGSIGDAEAKRMGGGKSFGSKPSYSQSHRQAQSRPDADRQQAATSQPGAQPGAAAPARSGMMGGLLGGLVMGGLLGALFFGGAFEGINFVDILLFGGLAFLLYKLFAARRQAPAGAAAGGYAAPEVPQEPAPAQQRSGRGFDTDLLFDKSRRPGAAPAPEAGGAYRPQPGTIPKGFDGAGFLDGAKSAYARLQQAWDEGDLADIRQFTTDKVFAEIQDQLRARAGENRTEILGLEAELLEVRETAGTLEAAVLFDAELREVDAASAESASAQVREVWHFTRPASSRQPTWYLDGIQQLED